MNHSVGWRVEGEREQHALAPKDTIQNFQFCSVEERTYSSNILRMWSKRWRVMGTPVAGSCSWHRLWSTISVVGPCSGGWEPQKLTRSCQLMSLSQGMCGTWPYSILPLEHQPIERVEEGQSAERCSRETHYVLLLSWHCYLPCLATPKQAVLPHLPQPQPPYLMEPLSSSICSRRRCASSCRAARSCCSLQMYSAVFCKVVALLTWETMG